MGFEPTRILIVKRPLCHNDPSGMFLLFSFSGHILFLTGNPSPSLTMVPWGSTSSIFRCVSALTQVHCWIFRPLYRVWMSLKIASSNESPFVADNQSPESVQKNKTATCKGRNENILKLTPFMVRNLNLDINSDLTVLASTSGQQTRKIGLPSLSLPSGHLDASMASSLMPTQSETVLQWPSLQRLN